MYNLPLELVDLICIHIKPELLVRCDLLPELNRKRIEHYWTHRCPCCLVENNDLQGIKYNIYNSNYNLTVIFDLFLKASKCGYLDIIKYFISLKVVTILVKSTGMIHATKNNDFDMVKYLADQGADITWNNDHALILACENGNLKMVKYFISLGADITTTDNQPVIVASKKGNLKIVRYLVELDAEILNDYRVIEWAGWSGNIRLVKYLIDQGADNINNGALIRACENGQLNMVKYLINTCYTKKQVKETDGLVIGACASGNLNLVKYLETLGADINVRKNKGVYKAIKHGHLGIVKYFVSKEINIITNDKAIIKACKYSHLNIVKYLVSLGEKINPDSTIIGCSRGNIKLSKYLINNCKNINDNFLDQILIKACHDGFKKLVEFLVEKGVNVQAENNKPLIYASLHGHLKLMKYLIEKGANPLDEKVLFNSVKYGDLEIVKYLVSLGVNFRAQNDMALQIASDYGLEEIEEYLVSLGSKLPDDYVYVDRAIESNESDFDGIDSDE